MVITADDMGLLTSADLILLKDRATIKSRYIAIDEHDDDEHDNDENDG